MPSISLFTALLLALTCAAHAEDIWSTAIAERPSDGWKIVYRFIDKLEDSSQQLKYPVAVTFTWKYDGPNGMPAKAETGAIYQLEDLLDAQVEKRGKGRLGLVSTGNNQRSWTYYVRSEPQFRKVLADASAKVHLSLEVSSAPDPQWKRLEAFRKGIQR
jgi:hypothetical protein